MDDGVQRPLSAEGLCMCLGDHAEVEGLASLLMFVAALCLVQYIFPFDAGAPGYGRDTH